MNGPKHQKMRSGRADAGEPVGGPGSGGMPTSAAPTNRGLGLPTQDQGNQDSILSPLGRCSHLLQAGKPRSGETVGPEVPAGEEEAIDARDEARVAPSADLHEVPERPSTHGTVAQPKGRRPRSKARAERPLQGIPRQHAQAKSRDVWADEFKEKKARASRHEQRIASAFKGRCVPGSGSLGESGDVKAPGLYVSCKSTKLRDLRIVECDHIIELARQAEDEGATPVIALEFPDIPGDVDRDWLLIPARTFRGLWRTQKQTRPEEAD
jgi:hypothetical protein